MEVGDQSRVIEETARQTEPPAIAQEPELAAHPGPKEYVRVAVALAIATAFEVGLYYMKSLPHGLFVGLLLFFAVLKFSLVALWFMHLRFDSRIFRRLFVTGLMLAITVYLIVLVTFGALKAPWLLGVAAFLLALSVAWLLRRARTAGSRPVVGGASSEHG